MINMYFTLIGLKRRFWGFRSDAWVPEPGIHIIFILTKPLNDLCPLWGQLHLIRAFVHLRRVPELASGDFSGV